MTIRSTILGIAGAVFFTAALGGIATADDQMLGRPDGFGKIMGNDFERGRAPNAGVSPAQALDRDGKMMGAPDDRAAGEGRIDPGAEIRGTRLDLGRPDATPGAPPPKGD